MRARWIASLLTLTLTLVPTTIPALAADGPVALPKVPEGWKIELLKQAPEILYPTAIVTDDTQSTIYLGQDPMDMPGPPTEPIDSVVAIKKDGKVTVFADKLWAVMGLEWDDHTLFVVHPPYLSAFRDTNHDGKADKRVDLITGLGPRLPGFNGINDHVASGVRMGMDGFLYIAVGDKGIPHGVGKDGTVIQLFGGGVIRIKPDGTGLEVVSTGERNPLSVALSPMDDIFTFGNDDDSKKWPNSLTHHIVGGHYGYPYQFLNAPGRALPVLAGEFGGAGAQAIVYNESRLPDEYDGNLFACDWGLQTVFRYQIKPKGGTFEVVSKAPFVTKGEVDDFRPFSICGAGWGTGFYLVDWGYNGWLASGPKAGRLYRLTFEQAIPFLLPPLFPPLEIPVPPTRNQPFGSLKKDDSPPEPLWIETLDDSSMTCRLWAQRGLSRYYGSKAVKPLVARLRKPDAPWGRVHAIWALDATDEPEAAQAIREVMTDPEVHVRRQAVRSAGIRRDQKAFPAMLTLLKDEDAVVRREAAIALGKLGDKSAAPALMAALGDPDTFVAWSIRHAVRTLNAWDAEALTAALLDPKRRDDALKLCDEAWAAPVVEALIRALPGTEPDGVRARAVATLAGLYRKYPRWSGQWFGTNPLAGQFPQKTEGWDAGAMARVQEGLRVALKDASPEVRLQAIAGLIVVGKPAAPALRGALATETDAANLAAAAQGLGLLGDNASAQALGVVALDPNRPEPVRAAAIDALGNLRGPQALTARISIVYDPKAPASLVARALPALGREGIIPPNDLAGFLDRSDPSIRAAALRALTARKDLPNDVREAVLSRLDDPDSQVRRAAVELVVALGLREAVPKLLALALRESTRGEAMEALAALPDPRALPVYIAALSDRSPEVRRAGEAALVAIRDSVRPDLESAARKGRFDGPAAAAMERVLARFKPVTDWKAIGPFARTTPQVFIGEPSIDFTRPQTGAEGRAITWAPRKGDPTTGRVVIDDLKRGAGDRGGFGYDLNSSPDLSAFGFAEIQSDRDREALLRIGSSGAVTVTVNERAAFNADLLGGWPYRPESDLVRVTLQKGNNRILVLTRQGVGSWSFGVQVSEPPSVVLAGRSKTVDPEVLRAFATRHEGDPRSGEALFFDAKGIGCARCHAAAGRGAANIGPDLTGLALKYDRAEIIRSVLDPSNRIANGYQPVVLATGDGKVISGLVRSETEGYVEVVDAETKVARVPKQAIVERKVSGVSVMPTGQVDSLSPIEFTDLISYLLSLKTAPAAPAAPGP
jgi:putative heme-binding domain-containing protein